MNPLVAVIADDLTGVCDTGAQFAVAGLRTIGSVDVRFSAREVPQVLLVNTQSRSLRSEEASLAVRQAALGLKELGPRWFFKKIDTALRGHIAVEVASMMETLSIRSAIYVASIPGAGRTTVNGCQFYRGVLIKESIHGDDRLNPNPISTSSNVELLSRVPALETEVIGLKEVRSGHLEVSDRLAGRSRKILIVDSETDEDIDQIVRASMRLDPFSFVFVGSFGLSSGLGRYLGKPSGITREQEPSLGKKRVLIVSGSSHPMARSQISHLHRKRSIEVVQLEPEELTHQLDASIARAAGAFQSIGRRQKRIALTIGEGKSDTRKQSQELVVALARVVRSLIDSNEIDGLVLIGGETGYEVCRAIGIERIEILGNISFVAAYGIPDAPCSKVKLLATKGGSLGEEDTVEKILDFIDLRLCR